MTYAILYQDEDGDYKCLDSTDDFEDAVQIIRDSTNKEEYSIVESNLWMFIDETQRMFPLRGE